MEEPLLPTPTSNQPGGSAEQHLARKRRMPGGPRNSVTDLRMKLDQLSSPSSPVSADSTLPSNPSDGSASDRSSGTPGAESSSPDTGRLFPVGPMSESSPLLPTPMTAYTATDAESLRERRRAGNGQRRVLLPDLRVVLEEVVPMEASSISSREASRDHASPSATPASGRPRTTTAGSGPSSVAALMSFDPDGSLSRMSPDCSVQENLPGLPSPKWSGTWPKWGSCLDGVVYALPTSVLPTDGRGSSSLLQTPRAEKLTPQVRADFSPPLAAQILALLPSPRTPSGGPDSTGSDTRPSGAKGTTNLAGELLRLGDHTSPPFDVGKP